MSDQPASMPLSEIPTVEFTPELLSTVGEFLSRSTLFALRRNYLDAPVLANHIFRLVEAKIETSPDVAFFEVEQVGKPVEKHVAESFGAIQTTLAACHDPRYALIFIISSNGIRSHIYVGVTRKSQGHPTTVVRRSTEPIPVF